MEPREATWCEREGFLYWRRPGQGVHADQGKNLIFCDQCVPVLIIEDSGAAIGAEVYRRARGAG